MTILATRFDIASYVVCDPFSRAINNYGFSHDLTLTVAALAVTIVTSRIKSP